VRGVSEFKYGGQGLAALYPLFRSLAPVGWLDKNTSAVRWGSAELDSTVVAKYRRVNLTFVAASASARVVAAAY
jgi:hypothetical protein